MNFIDNGLKDPVDSDSVDTLQFDVGARAKLWQLPGGIEFAIEI